MPASKTYEPRRLFGSRWPRKTNAKREVSFVGIEGYVSLESAQLAIFGNTRRQLTWSLNGSVFSMPTVNEFGQRAGLDPASNPLVSDTIDWNKSRTDGPYLFTLVDTYTLTATVFWAQNRPDAVLICGNEGVMHRALLCSYDTSSEAFIRETTLRMELRVAEKMHQMGTVQLSINGPVRTN